MNSDNDIDSSQGKVLSNLYEEFRCQLCSSISQPIAHTHFQCPPDYQFLDIYICVWCESGFVLNDDQDGCVERVELSQKLVSSWNVCEY